ncbi:hypothetical protein LDENG_00062210 [Lucifuga dentata]|nr:hypothetical protein LDENG_00062210 [Lucifuga dentata]
MQRSWHDATVVVNPLDHSGFVVEEGKVCDFIPIRKRKVEKQFGVADQVGLRQIIFLCKLSPEAVETQFRNLSPGSIRRNFVSV